MREFMFDTDDEFLNHPGLFGWTWSKKKAKRERQADAHTKAKSTHPFSTDDDCDTLQSKMKKIDRSIDSWSTSTGGKGHTRVKDRTIIALTSQRDKMRYEYEDDDCASAFLQEQATDFDDKLGNMMKMYQTDTAKRSEGSSSLMYVGIGVGVLLVGGVIYMATRR